MFWFVLFYYLLKLAFKILDKIFKLKLRSSWSLTKIYFVHEVFFFYFLAILVLLDWKTTNIGLLYLQRLGI